MPQRFTERVAIVTGGASGIGAAITERLAGEGAHVVVADINEASISSAGEFGAKIVGRRTDVTDEGDFEALIAETVDRYGTLDVLINVAGGPKAAALTDINAEDWDRAVKLNLYSAFYGTRLAARQFIVEKKPGVIVNIGSLSSVIPMRQGVAYNASKAAVVMLSRQAALELGEHGIRVNSVSPGLVETPLSKALLETPGVAEEYYKFIPARRAADPSEISAVVAFLASDEASYVSGQNLLVDGAWSTAGYPDLRHLRV